MIFVKKRKDKDLIEV